MAIPDEIGREIIKAANKSLMDLGFEFTFICGCHFNNNHSLSFPYIVEFQEDLFVEFFFNFLNMEVNKELKEKLLSKFIPVISDELKEFVKTVKL